MLQVTFCRGAVGLRGALTGLVAYPEEVWDGLLWNTSSSRVMILGDHSMDFGGLKLRLQPGRPHMLAEKETEG